MQADQIDAESTFEAVARDWFSKQLTKWKPNHSSKIINRLGNDVFPWIGGRSIAEIEAQLAHRDHSVRGVYNKAKYLPERIRMMQAWSEYLMDLKCRADMAVLKRA